MQCCDEAGLGFALFKTDIDIKNVRIYGEYEYLLGH